MSCPDVKFWQFFTKNNCPDDYDNPHCIEDVCFASLESSAIKVKFECEVDEDLNRERVNFWIKFLNSILDKTRYTYEIIKNEETGQITNIIWHLNSKRLSYYKTLLYLTAFRYPQEFPEIVLELYKHKDLSLDKLFDKFINIHIKCASGDIRLRYDTFFGHALITPYDYDNYIPISLGKFRKNLSKKLDSVNEYFGNLDY